MRIVKLACIALLIVLSLLSLALGLGLITRTETLGDFRHEIGNCYIARIGHSLFSRFIEPDSMDCNTASESIVYEDGVKLGPPHSLHQDIRETGKGLYSHWYDCVYLSSSDNSDPSKNNRKYVIKYPLAVPLYVLIIPIAILVVLLRKSILDKKQGAGYGSSLAGFHPAQYVTAYIMRMRAALAVKIDKSSGSLFYVLLAVAASTQIIHLLGSSIMYFPDSSTFIGSAFLVKDSLDFSWVGPTKTPGYALLLAGVLKIFGTGATFPLRVIQHFMVLVIIAMVYRIAYQLFKDNFRAFVCGLLSCFSFQLWAYANFVMSEIIYSLCLSFLIYAYLRYANTGLNRCLVLSFLLTGIATNVRPIAQYMIFFLFILYAVFYFTGHKKSRLKSFIALLAGTMLYAACLLPWMFYNRIHYNFFGMSKYIGLNLYSRVVEYENTIDYDSPHVKEIKETFEKDLAARKASGESERLKSWAHYEYFFKPDAWKHHFPAVSAYTRMKKTNMAEADDIFFRAALDCIKKYPMQYIAATLKYIHALLVTAEVTPLYVPGINDKNKNVYPFKTMRSAEEANKNVIDGWQNNKVLKGYFKLYEEPTRWNAAYAHMANIYYFWITGKVGRGLWFALLIIGFAAALYNFFKSKERLAWFVFTGISVYQVALPMLFVPGTYRMRVPMDPFLIIYYLLGFFSIMHVLRNLLFRNRGISA